MKTVEEMVADFERRYPKDAAKFKNKVKVKKKVPPKTGLLNKARKLLSNRQRNVDNAVKSAMK